MDIKKEVLEIPYVKPERNYWLVRTQSGKYYKSFYTNNYIAISWNEIGSELINKISADKLLTKSDILDIYKEVHKGNEKKIEQYSRSSSRIANSINRFTLEIKAGDIVLIPSKDSANISFGEVLEDKIYYETNLPINPPKDSTDEKFCPFVKRKKVRWLKTVKRSELDPKLFALFHSHHTISRAEREVYGNYIDRTIDSIYIKGETAHLILKVRNDKDINALVFANLIKESVLAVNSLNNSNFIHSVDGKNIKIKANVQSPGPLEFFGPIKEILLLATIILIPFGSEVVSFTLGKQKDNNNNVDRLLKEFQEKEFGIYKAMLESDNENNELISESLVELDVQDPSENINSN